MVSANILTSLGWLSWSAVIGGVFTAAALWLIMGLIGLAMGFKVVDPTSDHPASGLGKTLGIWTVVMNLVCYAGGAYVAGLLAGQRGLMHGFLTWAVMTVIMVLGSGRVAGMAVRGFSSFISGMGRGVSTLASGAHTLGSDAASAASGLADQIKEHLDLNIDTDSLNDKLNDKVVSVLEDTEVETLQPNYLKQQLNEVRRDVKKLIRNVSLNPGDYNDIITKFLENEKNRLQDLTGDLDKDAAVTALMNNRGVTRDEAERLVDNAVSAYQKAVSKARESVASVRQQIEETKEHIKETTEKARVKADNFTNSIAKGACAAAIGLILAALLSLGFGYLGSKCAQDWYTRDAVIISNR